MSFEIESFDLGSALLHWLIVVGVCGLVALLMGLAVSLVTYGMSGLRVTTTTVRRGIRDLTRLSLKRIGSVANLTYKEAWRRKAFMVGLLFVLLFMFGGWFLGTDEEKPAVNYVTFVMTSMFFLLNLMALLVACWGIPADIKARSLHTVVTKPVRRSEIVIGRMAGYAGVVTLVLLGTSALGFIWIQRQVPERAKDQLIARVPVYGSLSFLDRNGNPAARGINVGDLWDYRSFIEGLTQARAIWKFENLDVAALQAQDGMTLEQTFEAFRTYKGDIEEQVRYMVTLVNPETDLKVTVGTFPVQEFKRGPEDSIIPIPRLLTYRDSYDIDAEERTADLFEDLIHDRSLTVEIACVDEQQHIGVARNDLFIRMPDRPFWVTYVKSVSSLWLMVILVVIIGTSASCFLKGPVATIFTGSLLVLGNLLRGFMEDILDQLSSEGQVLGGGTFESIYRLVTQMNVSSPLPENIGTDIIKKLDEGVFGMLHVVHAVIPNFTYFNTSMFTANGFDVPWEGALLPGLATTLGFFIPLVILGYFSLQLRELEHK
jgi:hypothetical protein